MAANGSSAGLVDYQMYIDGEWVASLSGETFETVNPFTGTAWARVPRAARRTWTVRSGRAAGVRRWAMGADDGAERGRMMRRSPR